MSARQLLTDKALDKAKPAQPGQRYVLWDTRPTSLGLRVTDSGHKAFIVQRRVNGRMVKLTLGDYPALSLAKARSLADEALIDIEKGIDPRAKKQTPIKASALRPDSFSAAVERYLSAIEDKVRPLTFLEVERALRKTLEPRWATRPLDSITDDDVEEVLRELVRAGTPVAANRTRSIAFRFFKWAVKKRKLSHNPVTAVDRPASETTRERVLTDAELREIWLGCAALSWPFGPFVRGLMLTGQRRNELAGMRWSEVDNDRGLWIIPAARVKNNHTHLVPISDAFKEILRSAPRFDTEDDHEGLVFTTTGVTPVSGFSRAKVRLDKVILENRLAQAGNGQGKVKPLPPWTLHDLRRTCATGLQGLGIPPHVIEAVLNHRSGLSGVRGIYQRHEYLEERRRALEAWSYHVAGLVEPSDRQNIVQLPARA